MAPLLSALVLLLAATAAVLAKPASKIAGGVPSGEHEFPYQISLQLDGRHFCGGSLISDRFVLTAGHCTGALLSGLTVEVVAGEHDFSAPSEHAQRRIVDEFWVHEDYVVGMVAPNDVAVLRVDRPYELNEFVGLVQLPGKNVLHDGTCVISGWGSVSFNAYPIYPDVLQKAYLPIMDQEQCVKIWEGGPVADSNVCAGTVEGGTGVCSGDSGGPLVMEGPEHKEQVGIVSWGGVPCGGPNNPGVFVRVSYFIDWIEDKIARKD